MKRYIYIGCVVFLLSLIVFSTIGPQKLDINMYLLSLLIVLFLIFLRGSPSKNLKFYHAAQCIMLSNIIAYISYISYHTDQIIQISSTHNAFTMVLAFFVFLELGCLFGCPRLKYGNEKNNMQKDSAELFKEHELDRERLQHLMSHNNVVGVSGAWGCGKSFVVDSFCDHVHNDYYIININILAYKYGEADKVLIEKLDDIFSQNRIISASSIELKELMNHSFLNTIAYTLMKGLGIGSTSSSMYEALKEDITKLPKPVLVVFEDLERVKDGDSVRLLLAMAHQLACHKFKAIFEYDAKGLDELGISSNFREKFIPLEMRITRVVSYKDIANQYWKELNMDDVNKPFPEEGVSITKDLKEALLNLENFIFFSGPNPCFVYNQDAKDYQNYYQRFFVPFMTARNLREFFLANKLFFDRNRNVKFTLIEIHTVIAFYLLKYIRPNWYEQMTSNLLLEDMPLFQINNEMISFKELVNNYKNYSSQKENEYSISKAQCLFCLFQYNYKGNPVEKKQVLIGRKEFLEKENQTEISHMIWYLLEGGQKPFTNLRQAFVEFDKIASQGTLEEKFDKLGRWVSKFQYSGNSPKHKNQILIDISFSLYGYNGSERYWEIFLDFYQEIVDSYYIGDTMYLVLYYALLPNYPKTFKKILDIFTQGNCLDPSPVVNEYYLQFLWESLSNLEHNCIYIDNISKITGQIIIKIQGKNYKDIYDSLTKLEQLLENAAKVPSLKNKREDILLALCFIQKNLDLINKFLS